ncbi:MAG: RHS repeat-associated core domain-containing protein, partial [Ktedonobacterales bacterium]
GYTSTYAYDTLDRLTTGPGGSYTYGDSAHLHALTSTSDGHGYAYDASGNATCRTTSGSTPCSGSNPSGAVLSYDADGRLAAWQNTPTSPTTTDAFLYDGAGQRVAQQVTTSGTTTTTVYVGALAEYTLTGTTSWQKYYLFAGRLVAAYNGHWHDLLQDQLGTNQVQLNSSGAGESGDLRTPFGSTRYGSSAFMGDLGYTGQRKDSTPNLVYFNARYYDQDTGVFTSADTYAAGGLNRYGYVGGNPETKTDPSGHMVYFPPTDNFTDGRYPGKAPNVRSLGRAQFDWYRDVSYPNGDFTDLAGPPTRREMLQNWAIEMEDGTALAHYLGMKVDRVKNTDQTSPDYDVYYRFAYITPIIAFYGESAHFPAELYTPKAGPWDSAKNWVVPGGIVKGIIDKDNQASVVVVDLRNVDISGVNLDDIGYRAVFAPYQGMKGGSHVARVIFVQAGKVILDYNPLDYGPPPATQGGTSAVLA